MATTTAEPLSPEGRLARMIRVHPGLGRHVNATLARRRARKPGGPKAVFLSVYEWMEIICTGGYVPYDSTPEDVAEHATLLQGIGAWRYCQGIYRFDPEIRDALLDSGPRGNIPSDVLLRLPEWSLYIEKPGIQFFDTSAVIDGFWVCLEYDEAKDQTELRFVVVCAGELHPMLLHLGDFSVEEGLRQVLTQSTLNAAKRFQDGGDAESLVSFLARMDDPEWSSTFIGGYITVMRQMLSLVLYLCTDEPEIDNTRVPGVAPHFPTPKQAHGGLQLFPAERSTVYEVGRRTGDLLRGAQSGPRGGVGTSGRVVRPHLRRGHWHGYWKGPRDAERTFVFHWLPPNLVAADKVGRDSQPATT